MIAALVWVALAFTSDIADIPDGTPRFGQGCQRCQGVFLTWVILAGQGRPASTTMILTGAKCRPHRKPANGLNKGKQYGPSARECPGRLTHAVPRAPAGAGVTDCTDLHKPACFTERRNDHGGRMPSLRE
jgi:hypothetical protein